MHHGCSVSLFQASQQWSMLHLLETVEDLDRRGIGFRSLGDPVDTSGRALRPRLGGHRRCGFRR